MTFYEAFMDELEKLGKTRWVKRWEKGQISEKDLRRILPRHLRFMAKDAPISRARKPSREQMIEDVLKSIRGVPERKRVLRDIRGVPGGVQELARPPKSGKDMSLVLGPKGTLVQAAPKRRLP